MIRRSLFLGLMIVLGATLVYLILSARKQEKKVAGRPAEIIRTSKLSATRVLFPGDIKISGIRVNPAVPVTNGEAADTTSVLCSVTIQNRGQVAYDRFMIRLTYRNPAGREESHTQVITGNVLAGATVTLPGIAVGNLRSDRAKIEADIVWADLASDASLSPPQSATK